MNWASVVTGLGALAVAALSLILTYRARRSPYQEKIYDSQLEAASDVVLALGKLHDQILGFVSAGSSENWLGNFSSLIADTKAEFFRSYRRWSVVLPQSVTDALASYVRDLASVTDKLDEQQDIANVSTGDLIKAMAVAYSDVLAAARESLSVKKLTAENLRLIESQSRSFEPDVVIDPLYAKVTAERSLFDNFVDESSDATRATNGGAREELPMLREERNGLYVHNRNLFLIHTWRPSMRKGQLADISIRLTEHVRRGPKAGQASTERPLADDLVEKIEYDLGASFGIFEKYNVDESFRLDISAYGPTICLARVHFKDDHTPITLYRYLDFLPAPP